ncbi:hypothetical protein BXU11_04250 [Flavobacterium sp. LM5]|uniref:hypothetical protein n=1 Tax=Flavobacterium sp. LM5 TaxID=1938610 RepID=UPI000992EE70|nr:hypothetical protein [Flavobacterium sp. LM5]OOV29143.1 hypothetical protein BXU11_04250 [Flavobacterium sp. LM5]
MDKETSKKPKVLLDVVEKLSSLDTNRNFERQATAGRVNPTPSFTLKPKLIVKPKNDEGK